MDKPIDIVMWAGEVHYSVSSFIREAQTMGVSKRISKNSIPEGIVPGISRIFIKHRKAIIECEDWEILPQELIEHGYLHLPSQIYDKSIMLQVVMALEDMYEKNRDLWEQYVETFKITWSSGIIGYAYISGIQYVVGKGETGLPEDLIHLEGYVEPVQIVNEKE